MNVHYDFFGPEQRHALALPFNSANWTWPGDALSVSTHTLDFTNGSPTIVKASVLVCWWPESSAKLRFIHMDDGPSNIQNLGNWITAPNSSSPVVDGGDVTSAIQALIGERKHIGFQTAGQGRVGMVRLEIIYG